MSHQVENMFSVKETPWHGLGRIVKEAPTAEDAIKLAGLDWKVEERQIYIYQNLPRAEYRRCETHKALVRNTDARQLGILGKDYTPLQNSDAFKFFNPFVESGECSFETAGSLREGKTVWILAKLNKAPIEVAKGDVVNKYLLLSNGHDGKMAVRVGFNPVRVVCANTLSMAHGADSGKLIRIVHSSKVRDNVMKVREITSAANAQFEATAEQYKTLARSDVNQNDLEKFVKIVFHHEEVETDRKKMAQKKMMQDITRLFETGRGNQMPGVRGTYWALYNSVTEYLSYENLPTAERNMQNLWFGNGKKMSNLALKTALQMVAA